MREKISAVYASEVELFFHRIGLYEALIGGQITCGVCGQSISAETFKSVWRRRGELVFFCDTPSCEPDELSSAAPLQTR